MMRPACRGVPVATGSLVALGWLDPAGPLPASGSWPDLDRWYETVGTTVATVTALRWVAMAVAGWLLAACLLQLIASLPGATGLRPLADRITPAALRGIASVSLSAAVLATTPMLAGAGDAPGTATMHPSSLTASTTTTTLTPDPPPVAPASAAPARTEPTSPPPIAHTVVRGESFWSIAAHRLTVVNGPPPSDETVLAYWDRLVALNRSRLVDPSNADLIYAGQVFILPPTPPRHAESAMIGP